MSYKLKIWLHVTQGTFSTALFYALVTNVNPSNTCGKKKYIVLISFKFSVVFISKL